MLEKRKKVKLDLSLDPTNEKLGEFNKIELDIAKATEVEYMQKVFETLGHITGDVQTERILKTLKRLETKE